MSPTSKKKAINDDGIVAKRGPRQIALKVRADRTSGPKNIQHLNDGISFEKGDRVRLQ